MRHESLCAIQTTSRRRQIVYSVGSRRYVRSKCVETRHRWYEVGSDQRIFCVQVLQERGCEGKDRLCCLGVLSLPLSDKMAGLTNTEGWLLYRHQRTRCRAKGSLPLGHIRSLWCRVQLRCVRGRWVPLRGVLLRKLAQGCFCWVSPISATTRQQRGQWRSSRERGVGGLCGCLPR